MELTLIRHGQSTGNVARETAIEAGADTLDIPEREPDIPLTPLGEKQAAAVGRILAERPPPTLVLSSPYVRALETARIALATAGLSSGLSSGIRLDERLRDRDMGAFGGLTPLGVRRRFPEEHARQALLGKFYYRPPGGESWTDVAQRLRSVLAELPSDGRVLIATHDAIIVLFRYIIEGLTEAEVMEIEKETVANASVSHWRDGEPVVYNDASFLG
ncbi:histidine phosphatase family protein [Actinocorallia sp. A-T 12471]|uniref:histidine phosphatase family protein n=1 Tax=Actinocorallia sp. A-T 12471 TaxID=3089813 RepID=UPI0029CDE011|nr:histidine phosphatase family protein [Actinocorallia sp. A-T 12471]MDX6744955.1 histidine phosphatase family protein [Actinocorallia sp. A-T 12471]